MPYFAHSTASDIVIECTAAFAIADGTTYADPVHTQVVSMDSTLPGRAAATSSAASFSTPARRPHRCTTAPWSTRCRATPRPRPEPPPVIRMRLPSSSPPEKVRTLVPAVGGEVGTALLIERGDAFPGLGGLAEHLQG